MSKTQHQVLAQTDATSGNVKNALMNYIRYFKNSQGDFKGEKKTYEAVPGYVDIPANRVNTQVVTTVTEKIDYVKGIFTNYLQAALVMEATNASGTAKAELIVGNESWGEFTSLELLRLKSFVSNPKLIEMVNAIPTRSDKKNWEETSEEGYEDRAIYQVPTMEYDSKTTEKEEVILADPNIERAIEAGKDINYSPQTTVKTKQVVIGKGTFTEFSGEWSQHARAAALRKLQELKESIIDALQRANQVEAIESNFDTTKLMQHIFG